MPTYRIRLIAEVDDEKIQQSSVVFECDRFFSLKDFIEKYEIEMLEKLETINDVKSPSLTE